MQIFIPNPKSKKAVITGFGKAPKVLLEDLQAFLKLKQECEYSWLA